MRFNFYHSEQPKRGLMPGLLTLFIILAGLLSACSGSVPASGQNQPAAADTAAATSVPAATALAAAAAPPIPTVPAPALPAGSVPATATAAPVAPTPSVAARQAVLNAMQAVVKAGPYRLKSTTTTARSTVLTTGEVILPDHFHLTTNGRELLIVGNKTYMKQGDKWAVFPIDVGSMVAGMMGTLTADMQNTITDVLLIGPDTVNGVQTTVYQFQEKTDLSGTSITSTVKVWIDNTRGLPVRQQIDGEFQNVRSTTIQDIVYDPSIKIDAPAP